jgi:hypothetical protein
VLWLFLFCVGVFLNTRSVSLLCRCCEDLKAAWVCSPEREGAGNGPRWPGAAKRESRGPVTSS